MTGDPAASSAQPIRDPGAAPRPEGPIIDVEPVRAEAGTQTGPAAEPATDAAKTDRAGKPLLPPWLGLAGLALAVAIGIALLFMVPWERTTGDADPPQDGRHLAALEARLKALESVPAPADNSAGLSARIAQLEQAAGRVGATPLAPLSDVEALRLRIETLETLAQQAQARNVALAARLEALQAGDVAHTTQNALLALAASALDDAVHLGRGFRDELSLLQRLAPGDAALARLEPFADDGIEPAEKIAEAFPLYAQAAQDAVTAQTPAPQGFWGGVATFLSGFVTVRDEGVAANAPAGDTLNGMNLAAKQGDLAKAVALKDALPEEAQSALAPWLARANMHLAALNAARDLRRRVIADLAKTTLSPSAATQTTPPPVQ